MRSYVVERPSMRALLAMAVGALLALGFAAGPRLAAAQDASPSVGGSGGIVCEAATDGTPVANGATPAAMEGEAAASPAAALEPTPAGSDAADGLTAADRTLP